MLKPSHEASPLPFRVFGGRRAQPSTPSPLANRFMAECGVLVVQPIGPLRAVDFDAIVLAVDPWSGSLRGLHGLVIQAREFPGWENIAGFIRHVQVTRGHHESVRRVALATDVHVPHLPRELADRFIRAELRRFGQYDIGTAIAWAAD